MAEHLSLSLTVQHLSAVQIQQKVMLPKNRQNSFCLCWQAAGKKGKRYAMPSTRIMMHQPAGMHTLLCQMQHAQMPLYTCNCNACKLACHSLVCCIHFVLGHASQCSSVYCTIVYSIQFHLMCSADLPACSTNFQLVVQV